MARPKFDPAGAQGALQPAVPAADHALSVSQAAELIKSVLEQGMPSKFTVIGEVSNFSQRNHWYFSLKDAHSVLHCVTWATHARSMSFTPRDGDQVIATGYVTHYGPQGRTQMYVSHLSPLGAGGLHVRFQQMCNELRAMGYFDEAKKRPLPLFPRRIAVITSKTGAALQDVLATAAQRCRAVGLLIVDVRVQGEGAAQQVAHAINWVNSQALRQRVDAIVVTRGGGSAEDLWAFNDRAVADAAYNSRLPIVAAVGHESDLTIIELVADVRAATPTQAAMKLVPSAADWHAQISHIEHRLLILTRKHVHAQRARIDAILRHEAFRDPVGIFRLLRERLNRTAADLVRASSVFIQTRSARFHAALGRWNAAAPRTYIRSHSDRLNSLRVRLHHAMRRNLSVRRCLLASQERRLASVDPLAVLQRGFSCTTTMAGKLIRSVSDVQNGQHINTILSDGSVASQVLDNSHSSPGCNRVRLPGAAQMDLFQGVQ